MVAPATFNRETLGKFWNLQDIPEEWAGYAILLRGDLDKDLTIEANELELIDWISFSEAVGDFQQQAGLKEVDFQLSQETLLALRKFYGQPGVPNAVLKKLGNITFNKAEVPVSSPAGAPLVGRTPEERGICSLWNNYGAVISRLASQYNIPNTVALAVFSVESGAAYDPATGLVIIRFEPQIFKRKTGQEVVWGRGGQSMEWKNLEQAYLVNNDAALLSTSFGLPQLMGFNWQVTAHKSVLEMVLAFQRSCEEQVAGFFGFIEKNRLLQYVVAQDWRSFAKRYNGPGNVDVYTGKNLRALKVIETLKQDGAQFKG